MLLLLLPDQIVFISPHEPIWSTPGPSYTYPRSLPFTFVSCSSKLIVSRFSVPHPRSLLPSFVSSSVLLHDFLESPQVVAIIFVLSTSSSNHPRSLLSSSSPQAIFSTPSSNHPRSLLSSSSTPSASLQQVCSSLLIRSGNSVVSHTSSVQLSSVQDVIYNRSYQPILLYLLYAPSTLSQKFRGGGKNFFSKLDKKNYNYNLYMVFKLRTKIPKWTCSSRSFLLVGTKKTRFRQGFL